MIALCCTSPNNGTPFWPRASRNQRTLRIFCVGTGTTGEFVQICPRHLGPMRTAWHPRGRFQSETRLRRLLLENEEKPSGDVAVPPRASSALRLNPKNVMSVGTACRGRSDSVRRFVEHALSVGCALRPCRRN